MALMLLTCMWLLAHIHVGSMTDTVAVIVVIIIVTVDSVLRCCGRGGNGSG